MKSYSTTKDAKSTKVRNINVRILRDLRALRGKDINCRLGGQRKALEEIPHLLIGIDDLG